MMAGKQMDFRNLMAQLAPGQLVAIRLIVRDVDGKVSAEYAMGYYDQAWPVARVVESAPPKGYCRVTNLYVDPQTEKLVVEYDDTPTP